MIDYLRKFYEKLLSSILDPVATWVLALSLTKRILFLLLVSAGVAGWQYPEVVKGAAAWSDRVLRVARAGSDGIPLATALRQRNEEVTRRLLTSVVNDANLLSTGALTGWSAAQALLGIAQPGQASIEEEKLAQYIRATRLKRCACWPELNGEDDKRAWTFVSGWVLSALAKKGLPASEGELAFLLTQQNADGSWTSIPVADLPEYASVYTTAWAVIGLLSQSDAGLITDPVRAAQAKAAVGRGAAWLLNKRQANARWKSYPNLQSSSISGSISGLAMHALHLAVPEQMGEIDKAWLENIPASPLPASLGEVTYVELKRGTTLQIDHFVQLTMPWMLVATIDAYRSGNILQKTRALTWIEDTLSHESTKNADAEQGNWWRAELLIAMNYMQRHTDRPQDGQK
jgi:hypothetical protein